MPGITVTTGVRVGPTGVDAAPASTFFVAGTAERGPLDRARLILSMNQFETVYGGYSSSTTLHDSVRTFFEEGGSRCYVARVAHGTTSKASVTLVDSSDDTVITLTAANDGTWANSAVSPAKDGLKASVTTSGGGYSITITYKGSTVFSGGPYLNETMPDSSVKYAKEFAVAEINGDSYASNFVSAAVGASTSAAVADDYLFSGGVDNLGGVTDSDLVTGLDLFDYDFGAGAAAIPGSTGQTIWDGLRDHAIANRRIALCGFDPDDSAATALSAAQDYWGTDSQTRTAGSYMAFYWPGVTVPDGFGGSRSQSAEAYVAAVRSRVQRSGGAWRAPAGEASVARFVTGLTAEVNRTTADSVDAGRVNALRVINGTVRVYGARSVSSDDNNWRYITYRDTLNYITSLAETTLEPLVFSPIDGRGSLFAQVEARLTALMEPIRLAGGVYEGFNPNTGAQVDRGYSVSCNSVNNPTTSLANGQVAAVINARVSPVADQITISITKSTLTAVV